MDEIVEGNLEEFDDIRGFPFRRLGVRFIREIYENRLPFNMPFIDTTPETAVLTVIAIVTHDKILPFRNYHGTEIVTI